MGGVFRIAVLAAMVLALACFASCSDDDDDTGSGGGKGEGTVLTKEDVCLQLVKEGKFVQVEMLEEDGKGWVSIWDYEIQRPRYFKLADGLEEIEFNIDSKYTEIGYRAFSGIPITKITIPAGVKKIDSGAFFENRKLESVTFAEGSQLETIDGKIDINGPIDGAFQNCESLTEITIPASVKTIGARAFSGCKKLLSVVFADTSNWVVDGDEGEQAIDVTNPQNNAKELTSSSRTPGVCSWSGDGIRKR